MAVVALASIAILTYRALVREETLKQAAERCIAALERGDATTLMRYVTTAEAAALELDETKLSSLVNHFVLENLRGFSPKGEVWFEPHESYGELDILREYVNGDGRTVTIVLSVTPSETGPKLAHATEDIFFAGLRTYWPSGKRPPLFRTPVLNEIAMTSAMPKLETLALKGFAARETLGNGFKLVTWQELNERFRNQVQRIAAEGN